MRTREIRYGIKEVYSALWSFLGLYESTGAYLHWPDGAEGDAAERRLEKEFTSIRKLASKLFLGEGKLREALGRIVDETEHFARQCSTPGVDDRWREINPRIVYFEAAFYFIRECPECYEELRTGRWPFGLAYYPDATTVAARDMYFEKARQRSEHLGKEREEKALFQEELQYTLTLVFETDFKNYLQAEKKP